MWSKNIRFIVMIVGFIVLVFIGMAAYFIFQHLLNPARSLHVSEWLNDPKAHQDWAIKAGSRCKDAPFLFPTNGFIGYLWSDSFRLGHHHQGIDIFAATQIGKTPVIAAYDGFLTRLQNWKSSLIIRIADDPLSRGHQIWTYYTHMADESGNSFISNQFPPGTSDVFVTAGTLLGYQGDYSGDPDNPVGVHLHFSIVKDDGKGHFLNELDIKNTLDPSPYFKLPLNGEENRDQVSVCPSSIQ